MSIHTIHISKMTGKLEGLKAISSNTVTNPYCIQQNQCNNPNNICTKCYSHSMLKSYRKNMQPALERNSQTLSNEILSTEQLPIILDAFFRFNAHGELINETHLINLINIAKKNPHCNFALWSKRYDIVKRVFSKTEKPHNLIMVFSNSKISNILPKPPKYFDKTFNNVLESEEVERQNCTGQQCKNCLLCYRHGTTDTIVEMVKKY